MDWTEPMMTMFGLIDESIPQTNTADKEEEKFYNDMKSSDNAVAGAQDTTSGNVNAEQQQVQSPIPQAITAEKQAENKRRADMLRAKLLAARQNTPSKVISRASTPAMAASAPQPPPQKEQKEVKAVAETTAQPTNDAVDLEALLKEGEKRAAAAIAANAAANQKSTEQPQTNGAPQRNDNDSGMEEAGIVATRPEQSKRLPEQQPRPNDLNDAYYADLPAWLEITGYHNVEYRTSRLQNYRERQFLEQEQARIADRMKALVQQDQENFRLPTPAVTTNMAPPPLPQTMNGVKRTHSPEHLPAEKIRRREDPGGFRIRGANDSPDARPSSARRPQTPSPNGAERRVSYPEARRRPSVEGHGPARSRDPSLERRQMYYRHDTDRDNSGRYDSYTPRDPRPSYNGNNGNRANSYGGRQGPYRGSATLDLRKGAQGNRGAKA